MKREAKQGGEGYTGQRRQNGAVTGQEEAQIRVH